MRKILVALMLTAFVGTVPMAFALDANRDALKQQWRDQVNLQKEQARVEGLSLFAMTNTGPSAAKSSTKPKMRAATCACAACKI